MVVQSTKERPLKAKRRSIIDFLVDKQEDVGNFPEQNSLLKSKKIQCDYCPKRYKQRYLLKIHIRSHTGERPFKCDHCPKQYASRDVLKIHIRQHTGERPNTCEICKATFTDGSNFRRHCKTVHTKKSHIWKKCCKSYILPDEIEAHEKYHEENETTKRIFKKENKNKFQCERCPKQFTRSDRLKVHIRNHTGEKPLKCDHCPKQYASRDMLKIHIRQHTGERPYTCEICKSTFTDGSNYRKHYKNMHTKTIFKKQKTEKFQCDQCPKQYARRGSLKVHIRNHTGERPRLFKCDHCPKQYARREMLKVHIRNHTGEKPFKCDHCPKHYACKYVLKIHIRQHTGERPYACEICKATFTDGSNFRRHCKTVHTGK